MRTNSYRHANSVFTIKPSKAVCSLAAAGIAFYLLGWWGVLMVGLLTVDDGGGR